MGALPLDHIICYTHRCGIVAMDVCFWLRVPRFFEGGTKNPTLFTIEKEGSEFCLGGGRDNKMLDGA